MKGLQNLSGVCQIESIASEIKHWWDEIFYPIQEQLGLVHLETKHGIIPFFISIIWFDANIFTKISAIVYKVQPYIWHLTQDGELAIGNKTRSNLFHLRYIFWNVWHRCMKCMTQTCARWLPLSLYFWFWFGAKVVGVWIDQSVQSQIQKVWIPMFELISPTGHHEPHNKYR